MRTLSENMNNYNKLLIWHDLELIKYALSYARDSVKMSRTREDYFTENVDDFYPHDWVIDAICQAIKDHAYE